MPKNTKKGKGKKTKRRGTQAKPAQSNSKGSGVPKSSIVNAPSPASEAPSIVSLGQPANTQGAPKGDEALNPIHPLECLTLQFTREAGTYTVELESSKCHPPHFEFFKSAWEDFSSRVQSPSTSAQEASPKSFDAFVIHLVSAYLGPVETTDDEAHKEDHQAKYTIAMIYLLYKDPSIIPTDFLKFAWDHLINNLFYTYANPDYFLNSLTQHAKDSILTVLKFIGAHKIPTHEADCLKALIIKLLSRMGSLNKQSLFNLIQVSKKHQDDLIHSIYKRDDINPWNLTFGSMYWSFMHNGILGQKRGLKKIEEIDKFIRDTLPKLGPTEQSSLNRGANLTQKELQELCKLTEQLSPAQQSVTDQEQEALGGFHDSYSELGRINYFHLESTTDFGDIPSRFPWTVSKTGDIPFLDAPSEEPTESITTSDYLTVEGHPPTPVINVLFTELTSTIEPLAFKINYSSAPQNFYYDPQDRLDDITNFFTKFKTLLTEKATSLETTRNYSKEYDLETITFNHFVGKYNGIRALVACCLKNNDGIFSSDSKEKEQLYLAQQAVRLSHLSLSPNDEQIHYSTELVSRYGEYFLGNHFECGFASTLVLDFTFLLVGNSHNILTTKVAAQPQKGAPEESTNKRPWIVDLLNNYAQALTQLLQCQEATFKKYTSTDLKAEHECTDDAQRENIAQFYIGSTLLLGSVYHTISEHAKSPQTIKALPKEIKIALCHLINITNGCHAKQLAMRQEQWTLRKDPAVKAGEHQYQTALAICKDLESIDKDTIQMKNTLLNGHRSVVHQLFKDADVIFSDPSQEKELDASEDLSAVLEFLGEPDREEKSTRKKHSRRPKAQTKTKSTPPQKTASESEVTTSSGRPPADSNFFSNPEEQQLHLTTTPEEEDSGWQIVRKRTTVGERTKGKAKHKSVPKAKPTRRRRRGGKDLEKWADPQLTEPQAPQPKVTQAKAPQPKAPQAKVTQAKAPQPKIVTSLPLRSGIPTHIRNKNHVSAIAELKSLRSSGQENPLDEKFLQGALIRSVFQSKLSLEEDVYTYLLESVPRKLAGGLLLRASLPPRFQQLLKVMANFHSYGYLALLQGEGVYQYTSRSEEASHDTNPTYKLILLPIKETPTPLQKIAEKLNCFMKYVTIGHDDAAQLQTTGTTLRLKPADPSEQNSEELKIAVQIREGVPCKCRNDIKKFTQIPQNDIYFTVESIAMTFWGELFAPSHLTITELENRYLRVMGSSSTHSAHSKPSQDQKPRIPFDAIHLMAHYHFALDGSTLEDNLFKPTPAIAKLPANELGPIVQQHFYDGNPTLMLNAWVARGFLAQYFPRVNQQLVGLMSKRPTQEPFPPIDQRLRDLKESILTEQSSASSTLYSNDPAAASVTSFELEWHEYLVKWLLVMCTQEAQLARSQVPQDERSSMENIVEGAAHTFGLRDHQKTSLLSACKDYLTEPQRNASQFISRP